MRPVSSQAARFAVVGGTATLSHLAVAVVLVEGPGLAPVLANFLAFCAAVLVSYLGNHSWTFGARGEHLLHFPRFAAIAVTGLALNQAIVYTMVEVVGADYRLALVVVVLVVPALSFALNRGWVFSRPS
ncbi:MAG: GtrA family protein [Rhodospirillales bacterium]|nr:GtrA family protein [Rhodospirillales bacterium]